MDILKTATGKQFQSDYIAKINNPPRLYVRVIGSDYGTVGAVFSDPRETMTIFHGEYVVTGHTRLVSLSTEEGAIKVALAGD